jgi:hypothetical protein
VILQAGKGDLGHRTSGIHHSRVGSRCRVGIGTRRGIALLGSPGGDFARSSADPFTGLEYSLGIGFSASRIWASPQEEEMSEQRSGRAEAALAIWNWRDPQPHGPPPPPASRERVRGSFQAAIVAAIAGLLLLLGVRIVASVMLGAAAIVLLAALASPRGLYAVLDRMAQAIGSRIGRALTWLLLVPLFYLFFLPFGLLFRRGRRDRLRRYFDAEAPTYWEAVEGPTAASSSHETQW